MVDLGDDMTGAFVGVELPEGMSYDDPVPVTITVQDALILVPAILSYTQDMAKAIKAITNGPVTVEGIVQVSEIMAGRADASDLMGKLIDGLVAIAPEEMDLSEVKALAELVSKRNVQAKANKSLMDDIIEVVRKHEQS